MNKYNTLLGQLLSLVNRSEFNKLVNKTESDKYCKGFTTWEQFSVMLFAQITNQNGLRSIENSMNQNRNSFYHLGFTKDIKKSTLSYANSNRSCEVFEMLYYSILNTLSRGAVKKFRKNLCAIDATTIGLNMHAFSWAKFKSTKSGIKVNVKYDVDNSIPEYLFITNANEHENNTIKDMKLKKGDIVTFDRGYNNYEQFQSLTDQGIYFVTRLKDNAKYTVVSRNTKKPKGVTSDQCIRFTGKLTSSKCNTKLKRIRVKDSETGNAIILLTNIKDMAASTISKMYRSRWQIELFFKAIKQNLRIKKYYGKSENAVKTQVWIALITYLLYMKLKELCAGKNKNFTHFISELKVVIFQRTDLIRWFKNEVEYPPQKSNSLQQEFNF